MARLKEILTYNSSLSIYLVALIVIVSFFLLVFFSFFFFYLMWNHITYTSFSFFLKNCYFVNPFFEICNI